MRENIKWVKMNECTYHLLFKAWYDYKHIATLSIKDGNIYMHIQKNSSDAEDIICKYIDDSSIAYAKREITDAVERMIEDKADYYKAIYDKFTEEEEEVSE